MAGGQKKKDASERLKDLERWSGRATFWILGGVGIEIAILFVFRRDVSNFELSLAVTANLLIAAGLVVEYICILRTIVASGEF
jgi:hypothetical protein